MRRLTRLILVLLLLPIALPILIIIYLCVIAFSGKPALYKTQRVGKNRINFKLLKFRTMKSNTENLGPITALGDPRITKFGRLLRNSKLDELPQLINILIGDIAFIGPRPEAPEIVDKYYDQRMLDSLAVRPGLIGAGTLFYLRNFQTLIDPDSPEQSYVQNMLKPRLEADLEYQYRRTFFSDIAIVVQTFAILISRLFSKLGRE